MLQGIAIFSMQGRWQSALAIALLSLGALLFPPLSYLANGVVTLATLRMGPKEGMKVVLATTVIFTLLAGLVLKQITLPAIFLLTGYLPVYGASLVLGYSRSLSAAVLFAGGLGLLLVMGIHLVLAEPALWWQQQLTPYLTKISEQPGWQFDKMQTQVILKSLSAMMTAILAAGLTLNVILGLIVGRSWQARLYNPSGFAQEFRKLNLGKAAAMLTVALMIATVIPAAQSLSVLHDSLPVMLIVFALQGLSVIHAIVNQRGFHRFWLITVYVLLVVTMPQMLVLLATVGVLEQWFKFRQRSTERRE